MHAHIPANCTSLTLIGLVVHSGTLWSKPKVIAISCKFDVCLRAAKNTHMTLRVLNYHHVINMSIGLKMSWETSSGPFGVIWIPFIAGQLSWRKVRLSWQWQFTHHKKTPFPQLHYLTGSYILHLSALLYHPQKYLVKNVIGKIKLLMLGSQG